MSQPLRATFDLAPVLQKHNQSKKQTQKQLLLRLQDAQSASFPSGSRNLCPIPYFCTLVAFHRQVFMNPHVKEDERLALSLVSKVGFCIFRQYICYLLFSSHLYCEYRSVRLECAWMPTCTKFSCSLRLSFKVMIYIRKHFLRDFFYKYDGSPRQKMK